jgi:hypothetical protein
MIRLRLNWLFVYNFSKIKSINDLNISGISLIRMIYCSFELTFPNPYIIMINFQLINLFIILDR